MKNRTDLNTGKVVYISIIYHIRILAALSLSNPANSEPYPLQQEQKMGTVIVIVWDSICMIW